MAEHSLIEWTEATWNIVTGCTLVSEGCRRCYAAGLAATRLKNHPSRAGLARINAAGEAKFTGEVRFNDEWLDQPLRWKRPRMIFVCAHGDLFHEAAPDEWIDKVFAVMALAPQHTFQVLTKRPERMREYMNDERLPFRIADQARNVGRNLPHGYIGWRRENWRWQHCAAMPAQWPLPNVWLGTSVEDQASADERIPLLLDTPAAIRWISAEPLLGEIDLTGLCAGFYFIDALRGLKHHDAPAGVHSATEDCAKLDWAVVGGESGKGARPMHPSWARKLRDDCAAADVPFFMKQMGGDRGSKRPIPPDLVVRQWPTAMRSQRHGAAL